MKKEYLQPNIKVIVLLTEDLLSSSTEIDMDGSDLFWDMFS